ncbi:MAG: hypothetical protein Q4D26_09775 [Clostridia bacterium]|nr:hypothetical protein [Clostridia bacterium]
MKDIIEILKSIEEELNFQTKCILDFDNEEAEAELHDAWDLIGDAEENVRCAIDILEELYTPI